MVAATIGYLPSHERSNVVMSQPDAPQEHVITARRSGDGFLTFDLKISHIIEQTLLRALNRPSFRKSRIKVIEEGEVDTAEDSNSVTGSSQAPATLPAPQVALTTNESLTTIQRKRKSDDDDSHSSSDSDSCDSTMRQVEYLLKRPCRELPDPEDCVINTKAISSIPASWLSRGISLEERRQFQQSIANASLCPYERKKNNNNIAKAEDDVFFLPPIADYEDYPADPFSSTSPSVNESKTSHPVVSTLYIPQSNVSNPTTTTSAVSAPPTRSLSEEVFNVDQPNGLFANLETAAHPQLDRSPYRPPSLEEFEAQRYFQSDAYS